LKFLELKKLESFHEFSLQKIRHEIFLAQLEVLVRWRPSRAETRYHAAWHPCGYVHELANYRVMDQWRARDEMGLLACPACPWDEYERGVGQRPMDGAA
jgi:hypothetical protein